MNQPSLRVIQYGLGVIGQASARLALSRRNIRLVGAVDCAPALAARDLGDVLGLKRRLGLPVAADASALLRRVRADAVIHCTGSQFAAVYDQLAGIARAGLHCVSSCEEALFPALHSRRLADRLDVLCRRHRVAMVGTGVNPGFAMDTLAAVATAACQEVRAVRVWRVVDAATRREALQRKVGATITPREFRARVRAGTLGHAGLTESLAFVADALGWKLGRVTEQIDPVVATRRRRTAFFAVAAGHVLGVHQIARGFVGRREVLTLDLQMSIGAPRPRDEIRVEGTPPLRLVVPGGVPGDLTTPAMLVNSLPRLREAAPGWHTMRTLSLPHGVA
ncbi:dihydrodipicolinate reductase [bacterium]|nr:dihydrodipicolinate reductase [bacterium]